MSATADPEIPPKMTLVTMLTWANPPRNRPHRTSQNSMSLSESPTLFMMSPARRKNGRASRAKLSMAEKNRWGSIVRRAGSPTLKKPNRAVRPMAKPMGTPINIRPKKTDRIKPAMEFSYLSVPMEASITRA